MPRNVNGATPVARSAAKRESVSVSTRAATLQDVAAITDIFNQGVEDKVATLDGRHTLAQRLAWFKDHKSLEPVIVAEKSGQVLGWASLSKYSQRECFDLVKELSIYVQRDWRSKGVGDTLMKALLERGTELGVHKVLLFVFPANQHAIALYRKHGFVKVGVFHQHGFRDGEWLDSMAMERVLTPS